jgi:hypothetical protein
VFYKVLERNDFIQISVQYTRNGFQYSGNHYKQTNLSNRMEKEVILNVLKRWNFWKNDVGTGIPRKKYLKEGFS